MEHHFSQSRKRIHVTGKEGAIMNMPDCSFPGSPMQCVAELGVFATGSTPEEYNHKRPRTPGAADVSGQEEFHATDRSGRPFFGACSEERRLCDICRRSVPLHLLLPESPTAHRCTQIFVTCPSWSRTLAVGIVGSDLVTSLINDILLRLGLVDRVVDGSHASSYHCRLMMPTGKNIADRPSLSLHEFGLQPNTTLTFTMLGTLAGRQRGHSEPWPL